jgi:hypothetical protein
VGAAGVGAAQALASNTSITTTRLEASNLDIGFLLSFLGDYLTRL